MPRVAAYHPVAIGLHWIIGLGIAAGFGLGLYMTGLPFSPAKLQYYSWHKWLGVTIFLLVLLRLAWRLGHAAPASPADMPAWQVVLSAWSHRLLYVLMFAVPLSGWLMSSAKGVPTVYFGMWPLPDLLPRDRELGDQLLTVHFALNCTMAIIVLVHSLAAFKHHVVDRDDVLARMLPFLKPRQDVPS